jgi:hypothetical protein
MFRSSALALAVGGTFAWVQINSPLRVQPASKLSVAGTSTVKSFECRAAAFDAAVEATAPDAVAGVLSGVKAVGAVELKVPSAQLDCGNGTMNDHMRKALKVSEFATIAFTVKSYELTTSDAGTRVQMQGTLALSGAQKDIVVEADARPAADGALLVAGSYQLNMKDYGIKPPTLMFGALKVGEKVTVKFELLLKP